jgi:hypothetical protein
MPRTTRATGRPIRPSSSPGWRAMPGAGHGLGLRHRQRPGRAGTGRNISDGPCHGFFGRAAGAGQTPSPHRLPAGAGRSQRPGRSLLRPGHRCAGIALVLQRALFTEVRRVLKPGGLFAAWTYTLLHGDPDLSAIVRDYSTNTVGAYWPPERRWVDLGYRGMPFPCADIEAPDFEIRRDLTLDDVLDYLRTWSSTQRCIKETGVDPCALRCARRLKEVWPDPGSPRRPLSGPSPCVAGGSNEQRQQNLPTGRHLSCWAAAASGAWKPLSCN